MTVSSLAQHVYSVAPHPGSGGRAAGHGAEPSLAAGDWPHYGGDRGSRKYSPLDQINAENASKLAIAWTWDSPDIPIQEGNRRLFSFAHEYTPLAIGGRLYTSTSLAQVAAIDGSTGETIWVYNPKSYEAGRPTNLGFVHRGLAYWTDGTQERLYLAAHDGFLYAIDAKTGELVSEFGEQGRVNLTTAIPLASAPRNYTMTSPPVVCRDVVIVGSSISDGPQNKEAPRGDVQAFDARTGKPAWLFHTVPQEGEFGNDTWENDSWKYTGNTNVWTLMSADEELGYVYLPLSTPTNDWYGGQRLGDGLFAESLVCLDATTGKRVWHFQTVHHGVWDYDLPGAPVLCDIKVDGEQIPAVAQITKTGFTFMFDRTNGKPVWPIEERARAAQHRAGRTTFADPAVSDQAGPLRTARRDRGKPGRFHARDLCRGQEDSRPVRSRSVVHSPDRKGDGQSARLGRRRELVGSGIRPRRGHAFRPVDHRTDFGEAGQARSGAVESDVHSRRGGLRPAGHRPASGLPLFKPPWGRITAIDLNTGEHAWMVPHGDGPREEVSKMVGHDVGPLGSGGGGPVLTKTLLFIGQGAGGRGGRSGGGANVLRAFDKANGKIVAEVELAAAPSGTPMTYMADGKQYIVLATMDRKLVAISLGE